MAERYLAPAVAQLVENAGRRPVAWAEDRIRRDGRRYYAASKEARLRELLGSDDPTNIISNGDPDTRRKLTNLASAEASRKKKQFIQERSFQALRRICAAQRSLAKAVAVLVAANERQRKENVRIAALLAAATNGHPPDTTTTTTTTTTNTNNTNTDTHTMELDIHPPPISISNIPNMAAPTFDLLSSPVTSCAPSPPQFAPLHHHHHHQHEAVMTDKSGEGCEDDFGRHHAQNPHHNGNGDGERENKEAGGAVEEDRFVHFGTVDAERFLAMH